MTMFLVTDHVDHVVLGDPGQEELDTTIGAAGNRSRPFTAFPQPVSRASLDAPMDDHVYALYDKLYRQQNPDFPTSETFLKHLAFLRAKADITVTDWNELRTVSHDPNRYRSSTEPQEAIQQFLCLAPSSAQNQSRCFFGYATSASKGST